jgi:hypothetical protein
VTANTGTIWREQAALKTDLDAVTLFATVPVINLDSGDLSSIMDAALQAITAKGGKYGLSILIHHPRCRISQAETVKVAGAVTYKPLLDIEMDVTIGEDLLANRDDNTGTGIPALTAAEAVVAALQRPVSATYPFPRYCDGITPLPPEFNPETQQLDTGKVAYRVTVKTQGWATADKSVAVNPGP